MPSQWLVILAIMGLLSVPTVGAQDQRILEPAKVVDPAGTLGALHQTSPGPLLVANYENGQLTIKAHNVPLLDVLRQVCYLVGAEIDAPPGASEPIFADLGPGPAREVLTSLLAGSPFNFALQASDEDPNILARLVLVPMSGRSGPQNPGGVLEASAAPSTAEVQESLNPKEVVAQVKDLVAEARADMANVDPSMQDGAAQLLSMLENSMETLAATASKSSDGQLQPIPSAPPDTKPPDTNSRTERSFHHRRR